MGLKAIYLRVLTFCSLCAQEAYYCHCGNSDNQLIFGKAMIKEFGVLLLCTKLLLQLLRYRTLFRWRRQLGSLAIFIHLLCTSH